MPEIGFFGNFGLHAYIYYLDHMLPHVHITYGGSARSAEFSASFRIADGHLISGYLPGPQAKRVRRWIRAHQAELRANWDAVRLNGRITRIR